MHPLCAVALIAALLVFWLRLGDRRFLIALAGVAVPVAVIGGMLWVAFPAGISLRPAGLATIAAAELCPAVRR